ncbi:ABC transporter ATP-binding protein [Collinsella sp. HCP28S3_E6]|uniref:ABC transporter ATP-binding protein n=1 Tax=unclassified Collinsella TaxID=2637548 RepID=UPI0029D8C806|nr:energy-coupling factor transporter ATPase [Collinsella sp.]MCI6264565.1 energy-coupling factor transporter ATPase [Collinsella sp.]MCI6575372.1 energy-coupling factor transporter ATPase [Collinsella sp.]MCI7552543.1 energy-coupling factor transporter ATPase [Collinsella sp.]MCI7620430.1 energy-coupling factor transporter ATPase [Collinsella sp.]
MSSSNTIIKLDDVSFSYGHEAQNALDHVSLAIEKGEFVGVIGPSGAGKSTLAAVMSGAIPHHYTGQLFGATLVDDRDTCEITLTDISRVVGSVLQDIDAQMVAPIVEDEMLFGLENFGIPHDQIEERISQTLTTVGISDLRHREIATLSGGQKQKVAIAAIIAMAPNVLVLDEPTAALDPASSTLVFDTLRQINREHGITVVVIEQKVALLSKYCSRVLVMADGKLAFDGEPHQVFAHASELRQMGVDSPRVARIANSLAEVGLLPSDQAPCLNVSEAHQLISSLLADATSKDAPADVPETSPHIPAVPRGVNQEPVVELTDVTFAYPHGGASVSNLNMCVYPGELVGIIGQNGAGKTTLTKLLNGLLHPASGTVRMAGMNTADVPTSAIAAKCATLFQNPDRQLCRDTVLDEVAFGLELHGVGTDEARQRARVAAERFGLPLDESPFSLSRGQRQMVALASVVVLDPQVVLLDEPTSGLDYRECMTVMETVSEMAERGCAVIMVCHDMEVVSDFAQRLVVMADGRILERGDANRIFADDALMRAAYVEPPQVVALSKELARDVSPRFAGISQVSDLVDLVKEMLKHD